MKIDARTTALIIERYPKSSREFSLRAAIGRLGLDALTPEALRVLVLTLGVERRFQARLNEQNRQERELHNAAWMPPGRLGK